MKIFEERWVDSSERTPSANTPVLARHHVDGKALWGICCYENGVWYGYARQEIFLELAPEYYPDKWIDATDEELAEMVRVLSLEEKDAVSVLDLGDEKNETE